MVEEELGTCSRGHSQQEISSSFSMQKVHTSKAYRIRYSCEHSGSILRRSRWTAKWSFGLANTEAINAGKVGDACRGEEHEVRLVQFPRSKKARLYWNNKNITHLFRDASRKLDKVTFAWQARSGEIFQVIARSNPVPQGKSQFSFYIDGVIFANLRQSKELGADQTSGSEEDLEPHHHGYEVELTSSGEGRGPGESRHQGLVGTLHSRTLSVSVSGEGGGPALGVGVDVDGVDECAQQAPSEPQHGPGNLDFRLSMVGLSPPSNEVVDELRSDLYSPTIDALRTKITECIPHTEELVSRAIMNAFFSDDDSIASQDSLSQCSFEEDFFDHSIQLEADAVVKAYAWVNGGEFGTSTPDKSERMEFLQRQINAVFGQIRREKLSELEACQLLYSVACVLGLEVNTTLENTTVLLVGLDQKCTPEDLSTLKVYGEIATAAASTAVGYGLCRFCYPASVGLVTQASDRSEIFVHGRVTQAFSLMTIASISAMSFDSKRIPLETTLSIDDDYRLGNQLNCDEGTAEQGLTAREGVTTSTARFVLNSENHGCVTVGNSIEQLILKSTEVCASTRTVSTLDSDSETGTGVYGAVRYEKVLE